MPEELTPRQAAAQIGATTRSVQRWIESGRLPARRVGSRWRVSADAIGAFGALAPASTADRFPIRRLFVANRGEIAARIRRTCDRLDVECLVPGEGAVPAVELLDAGDVIAAALASGSDAIHPGYGFLAENADFADAVERSGLRWVGPPPAAMRAMGDKAAARRLAATLRLPVTPGYDGDDQSTGRLTAEAMRIGVPLLIKPASGGGGKGMRTVRDLRTLDEDIAAARREATAAFGDDRLILERLVGHARHVEVQVLFDRQGRGVHLGERDCSIQRRHQKVLEETPAPGIARGIRKRLTDGALTLARAVGYISAGTVEFLVEGDGSFHFLEMNTRLQVEHPVTELVTGFDLVAEQLRIAAGEPLGFDQATVDARRRGHAIEVRLYAEDAEAGFLPATGTIAKVRWPTGARIDTAIAPGDVVDERFDPMLAKIAAVGANRREALRNVTAALDTTVLLGLVTNLRFLRWLVRQRVVTAGRARTDSLGAIWPPEGWGNRTTVPDHTWSLAAARLLGAVRQPADPWTGAWRLNGAPHARIQADGDEERTVEAIDRSSSAESVVTGNAVHVDVDGRSVAFRIAPPPDVDRAARAASAHDGATGPVDVVAPMPGSVRAIHAASGAYVEAGQPVVTLEAMKMEHVVTAPVSGRVAALLVRAGVQVGRGDVLATVEP